VLWNKAELSRKHWKMGNLEEGEVAGKKGEVERMEKESQNAVGDTNTLDRSFKMKGIRISKTEER